tara:strand:+ start:3677 stop:4672 length:996 start_codon:yes stop_codon:yes gene_type:complete
MTITNILLTGGAGYIGSHVTNLLIDKGFDVTVIDSLVTGNKKLINKKAKFIKCDIRDKKKINKILTKKNFDVVLHFAGLIRVEESVKKPKKYFDYNYRRAKVFFDRCIENGINKIVFSSTASVYGNIKKNKVLENDILKPINPYAKSKMQLENYLIKKSKINKINFVILRYFNVAGADKNLRSGLISKYSTHLIKIICEVVIRKKKELIVNGSNYNTKDGTPIRDYIHVSDLAEIHYLVSRYLLNNGTSQIFNCGYGRGFSVLQVIKETNRILKKKIKFKIGPRRKGDIEKLVANVNKFNNFFSWKPKNNSLSKIIKTALDWEKKEKNYNK